MRRISQVGVAGWPVISHQQRAFSTLLRRPGLRAFNGGVLATTRTQNVSEYMLVVALCLVALAAFELADYRLSKLTFQSAVPATADGTHRKLSF